MDYIIDSGYWYGSYIDSSTFTIINSCVLENPTVLSDGVVNVSDGGLTTTAWVSSGGVLDVASGGTADIVTVLDGGTLNVRPGALVDRGAINGTGIINIFSGASVTRTGVYNGGSLSLSSGCAATGLVGYSNGILLFSADVAKDNITAKGGLFTIHSGGLMNGVTVFSGGALTVLSGGLAGVATFSSGGSANVFSGGTVSSAEISSYGALNVYAGGRVDLASISYNGTLNIYSGGTVDLAAISYNGKLNIISGGTVNSAVINGGTLQLSSGGMVNNISFKTWGTVIVMSGAIADGMTATYGHYMINSGGTAVNMTVTGGNFSVASGGTANDTTVNGGGMMISSGGTATGIMENGGYVSFSDGATVEFASHTFSGVEIKQSASIHSGTTANAASVNQYGSLTVFSGGSASGASVNAGGSMFVTSGGTATEIMENGGGVEFEDGASVTFARHTFSGVDLSYFDSNATVHSGTTAEDVTVQDGARLFVFSGGSADGVKVSAEGTLIVSSGGEAVNLIENGGYVEIEDGATVTFQSNTFSGLELYGDGDADPGEGNRIVTVHSGTTALSTTLEYRSILDVFSGGVADGTVVTGGNLKAHSGCVLRNTNLYGGTLNIIGGILSGFVNSHGRIDVSDGGILDNVRLDGGQVYVDGEDFPIKQILVWHLPSLCLSSGGTATDVAVTDGKVFVSSGGVVSGIAIGATYYDVTQRTGSGYYSSSYEYGQTWITNPGIHLSSGGKLTGRMTLNNGAKVFAAAGSIIDFDLTQAAAGGTALLTDIKLVEGTTNYTLTIDGTQENGTYRLAGGFGLGSVFSGMISVLNTSGSQLGILMVGQTFAYNDTEYTLGVADGCLSVTVQGAEVTPGDVDAPTTPTGLDAVVSGQKVALVWNAATDESSGVKEYVVTYTLNGQVFTARTNNTNYVLTGADFGSYSWSVQSVDFAGNESAVAAGEGFSVTATPVSPDPGPENASSTKGDIDGNGVSDVMFQWTGGDNQIGFWMNGHTQWQSQSRTHSTEWTVLGARDMNGDGKADTLMLGQASIIDMQGTYIGYYSGGIDTDANWHTIGFLLNQGPSSNAAWNNAVGNLTGNANANSIVWYSPNLYALGVWTDGTDNWTSLSYDFGGDAWTLVGCGDFSGDGRDSVVMTYNNGQSYYVVGLDDALPKALGSSDWRGWEVRAIGDFSGDGKDDIVLFHNDTGSMVMCADGNTDSFVSIGQLAADDWFVVGAGDYNGDQKDDLLVRQYSTGMLGYYSSGDTSQWVEMGRGVDMNWTVIA